MKDSPLTARSWWDFWLFSLVNVCAGITEADPSYFCPSMQLHAFACDHAGVSSGLRSPPAWGRMEGWNSTLLTWKTHICRPRCHPVHIPPLNGSPCVCLRRQSPSHPPPLLLCLSSSCSFSLKHATCPPLARSPTLTRSAGARSGLGIRASGTYVLVRRLLHGDGSSTSEHCPQTPPLPLPTPSFSPLLILSPLIQLLQTAGCSKQFIQG